MASKDCTIYLQNINRQPSLNVISLYKNKQFWRLSN